MAEQLPKLSAGGRKGVSPQVPGSTAFGQTVHTGAGILFLQGAAFLTSVLIARGLGAEAFGRFQLVLSLSIFGIMLAAMGLDEGVAYLLPRYQAREPQKVRGLIAYVLGFPLAGSLVLGSLFYWGAEPLDRVLRVGGLASDLRFLLPLLPALMLMTMAMGVLRGLGKAQWRAYLYYYLIGTLFLLAIVVLMRNGLTPAEAYWARIGSAAAGAAAALFLIAVVAPTQGTWLHRREIRAIHSFGGWIVLVGMFQYLIEQPLIDLLLVGRFDTAAAVGLYSVAAKAGAVAAIGTIALNVVMAPVFARVLAEGDVSTLRDRHREGSKWMAMAAVASGAVILLFHRQVLLLFGAEYQQASVILQIYAAGQIAAGLMGVNTPLLIASGFARVELYLTAAACALLVLLGIFLGVRFGAAGVATASAVSTVCLALARRVSVSYVLRRLAVGS